MALHFYRVTLGFDGRDYTVEVEHSPADGTWVLLRKSIEAWECADGL
ncbi:hypothetical protein SEA_LITNINMCQUEEN_41 [Gordonia phage LitninMcQueen]